MRKSKEQRKRLFEPSDFACDEAGTIHNGKHRTFWSGDSVLLSLYFTNRRYPDLQIHRIIKENLRYGHSPKRIAHYESILPGVAKRCSDRERLADEAEREVDKMKKVEYMQAHIGEMYEGIISGVTSWGIYVELDNTVEGMIALRIWMMTSTNIRRKSTA